MPQGKRKKKENLKQIKAGRKFLRSLKNATKLKAGKPANPSGKS